MQHGAWAAAMAAGILLWTGCGDSGDGGGGTGTESPTVTITSPAEGATVSGTVSIAVSTQRAESVRFRVDGVEIARDTEAPFATNWNSAGVGDGAHTLSAMAEGGGGIATDQVAVTVQNAGAVAVSVSPVSATVETGATRQFTATVTGTANTAVAWSVDGGAAFGTVSATGLYMAPAVVPNPAAAAVRATSLADNGKSAAATVTITGSSGGFSTETKQALAQTFNTGTDTYVLAEDLIDGAVLAVFEASILATGGTQLVTTGTLTQSAQDPEQFTYGADPNDRMVILLANGARIEVVYFAFSGYLEETWEDFRDFHDDLDFRVTVAGTADLRVRSASGSPGKPGPGAAPATSTVHQRSLDGTVVENGITVTVNATAEGSRFSSVESSSAELETSDRITGTLTSSLGTITVAETRDYHSLLVTAFVEQFARTNASSLTHGGSTWTFQDVLLRGAYREVEVTEADYWRAEGVLLRDGVVVGQVAWDRPIVEGAPELLYPKPILVLDGGETVPLSPSPAAELARAWAGRRGPR